MLQPRDMGSWIDKKTRSIYTLPPRDSWTKIKGVGKDISCKCKGKKSGVAILISDKIDFKTKAIVRDTEEHYIIIKGTIQQEDITLVNIHALDIGTPEYIK